MKYQWGRDCISGAEIAGQEVLGKSHIKFDLLAFFHLSSILFNHILVEKSGHPFPFALHFLFHS